MQRIKLYPQERYPDTRLIRNGVGRRKNSRCSQSVGENTNRSHNCLPILTFAHSEQRMHKRAQIVASTVGVFLYHSYDSLRLCRRYGYAKRRPPLGWQWWNTDWKKTPRYPEKNPVPVLFNPTGIALKANPVLRGGNCLRHGTAWL